MMLHVFPNLIICLLNSENEAGKVAFLSLELQTGLYINNKKLIQNFKKITRKAASHLYVTTSKVGL